MLFTVHASPPIAFDSRAEWPETSSQPRTSCSFTSLPQIVMSTGSAPAPAARSAEKVESTPPLKRMPTLFASGDPETRVRERTSTSPAHSYSGYMARSRSRASCMESTNAASAVSSSISHPKRHAIGSIVARKGIVAMSSGIRSTPMLYSAK